MTRSPIIIVLVALGLAACQTTSPPLIKEVPRVYIPDAALFHCPGLERFPDPRAVTDGEVSELLVTLFKNNQACKKSIEAIRTELLAAKERLEAK